jgi:hypothetical protein
MYLFFSNIRNEPDKTDENYDRLWKTRTMVEKLNDAYAKYSPTGHLAVDEVNVLFKGRVIFRQYIPLKNNSSGIKIYKLHDSLGYIYNMTYI